MNNYEELTRDDLILLLSVINNKRSQQVNIYKSEPDKFNEFLHIYKIFREILNEQQLFVSDELYGLKGEPKTYAEIAKLLNLSNSRIRDIRIRSERKIRYEIRDNKLLPYSEIY